MTDKQEDVILALQQPNEIRQSIRSENVLLYYRKKNSYHTCVIVRVLDGEGFIITAYVTDKVKEGKNIWKR